jgi:predicted ATPase/DNA-binding winged helix-turn-helix (wHTH) protein
LQFRCSFYAINFSAILTEASVGTEPHRFFPPFRLDPVNAQLWRGGHEIKLRRKTFDVLLYLVDHPGQLVTKAALLDTIWAKVTVSDSMPATCVAELRKALGDEARVPRFIETVHGRGYRFIAKVKTPASVAPISKAPSVPKRPRPIMVGRQDELAQLQSWYSRVLEGQRQLIFVTGEAGIGKTTFVQAFLDSIAQEGSVRIGRGQCVEQYGAGEPYMPVLEALGRLCQEPRGERLIELLNRFAPTWLAQMPAVLTREERVRLQSEMQGVTQQRMLREMTQALEALATETPLVLLLEDLLWSDFSTLELISAIARRSELARLLIVGTYRPVEMLANDHPLRTMKQELELHRYCEELRLKLLTEENVADYLAKRLASDASQRFGTLAPVIHARTDGNPLFMVNMVDYLLVDAGLLVNLREVSEAEWAETLRAFRLDSLRSIRQMIERNLERLKPEEQAVLEGASVAGAEFSSASVAAALECSQNEVEACCARLSRREQFVSERGPITWPDGTVATSFRFHHALYQEVLYGRLSAGHQVQLHRRIAMREEAGYGERAGEVATELAHHYSRANDRQKGIQYFQLAGERAVARAAMIEGERHFAGALELLSELPEDVERDRRELELQLAVGPALIAVKGWAASETERAYTRARELCDRLGESPELFPALFGMWAIYLDRGEFRTAFELAEQLLRAQSAHDPALLAYARLARGATSYWMGKFLPAREYLESAITLYDPERHRPLIFSYGYDAGVASLSYAAWTLWLLGYSDQALKRSHEALALAQRLSHPLNLAHAELFVGVLRQYRREVRAAQANAESVIAHSAEHGLTDYWGWATGLRGWAMAQQGCSEEGIAHLREGLAAFSATEALLRPYFLCLLAEAWTETGRLDDGLNALTEALAVADEHDLRFYEAETHRLKGELLSKQDDSNAAEAQGCFERAIEIARTQSAKSLELRATMSLARLLRNTARRDEASAMLAEIYGWFTEGLDTPALSDAKALLDELTSKPSAPRRSNKSRRDPPRPE